MDTKATQFRAINVIQLDGRCLDPRAAVPGRYRPCSSLHRPTTIAEGIVLAGSPLFTQGEWFLDSRYSLEDVNLDLLPRGAEDQITIYKVKARPSEVLDARRTSNDETHVMHGGLYYVGQEALKRMIALRSKTQALYDRMITFNDTECTTRRYPYPVRVLCGPHSDSALSMNLVNKLFTLYRPWTLDIGITMSKGNIRESHQKVFQSLGRQRGQTVLIVDPDFEPNGDKALMYELKGEERQYTHLWHTRNPLVPGLQYGHGSPKLITEEFFDFDAPGDDMTMSCSSRGITVHTDLVGNHRFDTSFLSIFVTTFREVYKLSKAADTDMEAKERLDKWRSVPPSFSFREHAVLHLAVDMALKAKDIDINNYELLKDMANGKA